MIFIQYDVPSVWIDLEANDKRCQMKIVITEIESRAHSAVRTVFLSLVQYTHTMKVMLNRKSYKMLHKHIAWP